MNINIGGKGSREEGEDSYGLTTLFFSHMRYHPMQLCSLISLQTSNNSPLPQNQNKKKKKIETKQFDFLVAITLSPIKIKEYWGVKGKLVKFSIRNLANYF